MAASTKVIVVKEAAVKPALEVTTATSRAASVHIHAHASTYVACVPHKTCPLYSNSFQCYSVSATTPAAMSCSRQKRRKDERRFVDSIKNSSGTVDEDADLAFSVQFSSSLRLVLQRRAYEASSRSVAPSVMPWLSACLATRILQSISVF